jgi:hypothetical protein
VPELRASVTNGGVYPIAVTKVQVNKVGASVDHIVVSHKKKWKHLFMFLLDSG